jgi:hypothetical protein
MKYSINDFIDDYETYSDEFYGYYDWFSRDESLKNKAKSFVPKLKFLVKEGVVDGDKHYVWFKENCPIQGSLYSDMRISTLNEQNFMGGFCPKTGHTNVDKKCQVWTLDPNKPYGESLVPYEFDNWNAFKKEVKTNPEFKKTLQKTFNPGV